MFRTAGDPDLSAVLTIARQIEGYRSDMHQALTRWAEEAVEAGELEELPGPVEVATLSVAVFNTISSIGASKGYRQDVTELILAARVLCGLIQ